MQSRRKSTFINVGYPGLRRRFFSGCYDYGVYSDGLLLLWQKMLPS